MKSIYLRNFTAMAVLVFFCLMLISLSLVGIGRMHLLREQQKNMLASAGEVARLASAIGQNDTMDSWLLGMNVTAIANATDNQILITEEQGRIVRCSEKPAVCCHIGVQLTENVLEWARENTVFGLTDLDGLFPDNRYVVGRTIDSDTDGSTMGYVFVISSPGKILGDWSAFLTLAAV